MIITVIRNEEILIFIVIFKSSKYKYFRNNNENSQLAHTASL